MPKTSAAERRPVNFHLQSSLHGATATVACRPDQNLPNIKMKGRRCPPLGASDKIRSGARHDMLAPDNNVDISLFFEVFLETMK